MPEMPGHRDGHPSPEAFHRRVTARVYIASHRDRLARQVRRAALVSMLSLSALAVLAAFAVWRAGLHDLAPPGLLGHLDARVAAWATAWQGYEGDSTLLAAAALVASVTVLSLLWWVTTRERARTGLATVPAETRPNPRPDRMP